MNNMVDASISLAKSRGMCCEADIELLVRSVRRCPVSAKVVQLGAGSGTMALAILAFERIAHLLTVDFDSDNLGWERKALSNAGYDGSDGRYSQFLGESASEAAANMTSGVDLLVVDADHSHEGVVADLQRWTPRLKRGALIFLHDYDGTTAPEAYPGVRQAADELLGVPLETGGWSAVFAWQ